MTLVVLLGTLAIGQTIFLIMLALLLFTHRNRMWRRRLSQEKARALMEAPVQMWLAGSGGTEPIRAALNSLAPDDAVAQLIELGGRVPTRETVFLAAAIRGERWVQLALRHAQSRAWWRRLEAARLLSVAGTERDRALLGTLLRDRHPAVQAVAAAAIPRLGGAAEVAMVLEALPSQSTFVQRSQHPLLAEVWALSAPLLRRRLTRPGATPSQLLAWIPLAEALGTADLLEAALPFGTHADADVRLAVAYALRKYYHPSSVACLRQLLTDQDWRVRAKAAQSLGSVGGTVVVDDLLRALPDAHWWVRFRVGLALAQLGERGRDALRRAQLSPDRFVVDMAAMISGLTPGSLVELSEG